VAVCIAGGGAGGMGWDGGEMVDRSADRHVGIWKDSWSDRVQACAEVEVAVTLVPTMPSTVPALAAWS
jgi:hypothetical protein